MEMTTQGKLAFIGRGSTEKGQTWEIRNTTEPPIDVESGRPTSVNESSNWKLILTNEGSLYALSPTGAKFYYVYATEKGHPVFFASAWGYGAQEQEEVRD